MYDVPYQATLVTNEEYKMRHYQVDGLTNLNEGDELLFNGTWVKIQLITLENGMRLSGVGRMVCRSELYQNRTITVEVGNCTAIIGIDINGTDKYNLPRYMWPSIGAVDKERAEKFAQDMLECVLKTEAIYKDLPKLQEN